jgi:hypothetical protein
MMALSIQQPWAWLIVSGLKDVENRTWRHPQRGQIYIHAGQKIDGAALYELERGRHPVTGRPLEVGQLGSLPTGGIVGLAEISDCVAASSSPWFVGPFGFVLRNARKVPFVPLRGALGFFEVNL